MGSVQNEIDYLKVEVKDTVGRVNQQAISRAYRGVNELRNAELDVLGQDGHGRKYKRGKRIHTASAPGEPPAPDTGQLRLRWRQSVIRTPAGNGSQIKMRIKSDVPYVKYLEGDGGHKGMRPFHEKIKEKAKPEIERIFTGHYMR